MMGQPIVDGTSHTFCNTSCWCFRSGQMRMMLETMVMKLKNRDRSMKVRGWMDDDDDKGLDLARK